MRWVKKKPIKKDGPDERTVTRFLWFPLTIGDETRWLEQASYNERWIRCEKFADIESGLYPGFWAKRYWIDKIFEQEN